MCPYLAHFCLKKYIFFHSRTYTNIAEGAKVEVSKKVVPMADS